MTSKLFFVLPVLLMLAAGDATGSDIYTFEDGVPVGWNTYGGGSLATSTDHYKQGTQSLKWSWTANSQLRVEDPCNLSYAGTNGTGGIKIWIYNETAVDDHLSFYFGEQTEIQAGTCKYKFDFGLNFAGWRAAWVGFEDDAKNPSWTYDTSMDWMYIQAPDSGSGNLYVGIVEFVDTRPWNRSADYQVPFVKEDDITEWDDTYYWSQQEPVDPPPGEITQDQIDAFAAIKQRYEDFLLDSGGTPGNATSIEEEFITVSDVTIDLSGASNEETQISYDTGYRWGGYNAAGSGHVQLDNDTDDRLRFRLAANTEGSYAYTVFDPTRSRPPANPDTVQLETITFDGSAAGLEGTYVRFMVRKAADSTWYLSDPVAAAEYVSVNVSDLQWTALAAATNTNLNALADDDEAALSTTGAAGSFSSKVGGAIDSGGFYIDTGTDDYFGINKVTWSAGGVDIMSIRYDALQNYIQVGLDNYSSLGITRTGPNVCNGTPLFALSSSYHPDFGLRFGNAISSKYLFPVSMDYRLNGNVSSKDKAIDLFDYMHDQGWAEGSSSGTLYKETNRMVGYAVAVFLMADELAATGRLERELATMDWYNGNGQIYVEPEYPGVSADAMRTTFLFRLLSILLTDDSPEKVRNMNNLVRWYNSAVDVAPGWADTIKPGYIGFHHRGIYASAYAPHGVHTAALTYYLLHDTPFELSEKSKDNINNYLLTARAMSNKYDVQTGISGRWPFSYGIGASNMPAYAYMALSSDPVDANMASVFMRLWDPSSEIVIDKLFSSAQARIMYLDSLGSIQLMQQLADMSFATESAPQGNWAANYGAVSAHRRDEWMAGIKGCSQYVWDYEASDTENLYGRYVSYGAVELLGGSDPVSKTGSGYVEDGWDWNRWPGTTAKYLPLAELKKQSYHRCFTDQPFAGGITLDNQNGIFAMSFHDKIYDTSFRFKKTIFCFDDKLICLGSGIENTDSGNCTETTIYQNYLTESDMPILINSDTPVTGFPYSVNYTDSQSMWLMDAYSNGYYIPDRDGLNIQRDTQYSRNNSNTADTSGDFATCWIDHGSSPSGESYEYVILPQSTAGDINAFADDPNYEVLQKDASAHIVRDNRSGITGYVLFQAQPSLSYGLLKSTDASCMVMTHQDCQTGLSFSICDPDLRLHDSWFQDIGYINDNDLLRNESVGKTITVKLDGKWDFVAEDTDATIVNSNLIETTIEFFCKDGKTIDVDMVNSMDFVDYAEFAKRWMDTDCGNCYGADFTGDGDVNMPDLDEFTDRWLITE